MDVQNLETKAKELSKVVSVSEDNLSVVQAFNVYLTSPDTPEKVLFHGWNLTFWIHHFSYLTMYQKLVDEMTKEYSDSDLRVVKIDEHPIEAGLSNLIRKVAICREYENIANHFQSKALKRRSVVQSYTREVERNFKVFEDMVVSQISSVIGTDSKTSTRERQAQAGTRTSHAFEVKGMWTSLLEECTTHLSILRDSKKNLSETRRDLLIQISGIKMLPKSGDDENLQRALSVPPNLITERYPENPSTEGNVSFGTPQ